jgi:tellurite resistance protein
MRLKRGNVEPDQIPGLKADIEREKEKLEAIVNSKPALNSTQKDRCASMYESLGKQIKDSMPTRKETKQGLVNPHDELRRLKGKKHISVDTQMAAACGVKPVHGKITGDEANKCYKILGKMLDENTNVERLRRDGDSEAYQSMNELTQAILDGREIRGN